MKNTLIIFSILLIGCSPHTRVTDKDNPGDTLTIKNTLYYLDRISKKDFDAIPGQESSSPESEIIDDTANVFRESGTLRFQLRNGSAFTLVNDTTGINYMVYSYIESCAPMDYWLLRVTYYAGGQYMLLDKENGNKMLIWGQPVYSPDRKRVVCYSLDLEAGYYPNGIELYEIKDRKMVPQWFKVLDKWGPSEIRWKDDLTLYIEQQTADYEHPEIRDNQYFRSMKIYQ